MRSMIKYGATTLGALVMCQQAHAHGFAGEHEARQPVLLAGEMVPANGARFVAIADGVWRDSEPAFERTFYIFGEETLQGARECWVMLGKRGGVERKFWKQQGGKWVEGP